MHDLPWLLKSADDFNERCARLLNHASPDAEAQLLANYALSINQSNRLYQTLQKFDPEKRAIFSRNLIHDVLPTYYRSSFLFTTTAFSSFTFGTKAGRGGL